MSRRFGPGARARGYGARRVDEREPIASYLIVCEGEKTEPNYFKSFRLPRRVTVKVVGTGANTVSVVREAVALRDGDDFDHTWCVFDRDSFPANNFNQALELARNEGVRVAYSNEAFELWYLLHFEYCDAGLSRTTYAERLAGYLQRPYRKNDPRMFDLLLGQQEAAIRNAARLLATYDPPAPERDNPSTTVHVLVEELRRLERDRFN